MGLPDSRGYASDERSATLPLVGDRVRIGPLGVSPICVSSVANSATVLDAFDSGVNFFMLAADMHWRDYEATRAGLGELLSRTTVRRSDIVVAAISWVARSDFAHAPFEEVLASVPGLGHLDLTVIGGAEDTNFIARRREHEKHRELFGAQAIGATFANDDTAVWAADKALVDVSVVPYGLRRQSARTTVFSRLTGSQTPTFCLGSTLSHITKAQCVSLGLPSNKWVPSRGDYVRFAMMHQRVNGAIVPLGSSDDLVELIGALRDGPLSENDVEYMLDLADLADGTAALDGT